ncbi:MAG: glycosyltransferase family 4 protein [Anditalea sp.]
MTIYKKKILFLTRYSRMGASSRLRTYQFLPFLREKGWEVEVKPLFNDQYLSELYAGKGLSWINVFNCYVNRMLLLFTFHQYERIVIEKELFPFLPSWAESLISRMGGKYIVDYDDAIFHNYDLHRFFWVRLMYKRKIDKIMKYSQKVLVGNGYLASRAKKSGAREIIYLPTVIDAERYIASPKLGINSRPKIGWIGSPSTLKHLKGILSVLEKLNKKQPFDLVIIGGGESIGFSGTETLVSWSEEGEVMEIQKLDIGIMPLSDNSWEKGKCAYKLIQYMACGLPVVGSPVGVNKDVILQGVNGFLPANENEWISYLDQLITDKELRVQMGKAGAKTVQHHYTVQGIFTTYINALA